MIQLFGSPALSEFRIQKLLTRLQKCNSKVNNISSKYIHFIDLEGNLSDGDKSKLESLLSYGPSLTQSVLDCLLYTSPSPRDS